MSPGRFDGRRVAVTGAASGIGLGIAQRLADEGAEVLSLDLGPSPIGESITADVRDPASMEAAAEQIGAVDGVVANAGIRGLDAGAEEMPIEAFDEVLAVNLRGVFVTCQAFGKRMLQAGSGSIVAIASMSGNRVVNVPQRTVHYNTAKAGVTAMVRTLAVEWGPRGVRVNSVSPGYVRTPLLDADATHHEQWKGLTVLGRFAEVDEIAAATLYLLSDESGYCCGTDLLVDGGYSLR